MRYLRYAYRAFRLLFSGEPLFWLDRFRHGWFRCETCKRWTHVDLGRAMYGVRRRNVVSSRHAIHSAVYGWCESCKVAPTNAFTSGD